MEEDAKKEVWKWVPDYLELVTKHGNCHLKQQELWIFIRTIFRESLGRYGISIGILNWIKNTRINCNNGLPTINNINNKLVSHS